jgi:hypothetical protein
VAGVLLFGCILLVSLFALQIAALELSDRLNIFPLYGFFIINLLSGLFLIGLIYISRKFSSRLNQDAVQRSSVSPNRLRRFWADLIGGLKIHKVKARTQPAPKPVAVLLIIKRQASEEPKPKSRVVTAAQTV